MEELQLEHWAMEGFHCFVECQFEGIVTAQWK